MPNTTPGLRGRAGMAQRDRRLKRTNYLCEDCQAEGRVTIATIVDHIIPLPAASDWPVSRKNPPSKVRGNGDDGLEDAAMKMPHLINADR